MKNFYNKLHEVFDKQETKDTFINQGVPPVRYIDLYAGQEYDPQNFEAHLFPAVFVRWSIDYKQSPPIATLTFRLCYEQLRDMSNISQHKQEALKFIDFIALVDAAIKSIETLSTGKISLMSEDLSIEDTVVDVYILTYHCSYVGKQSAPQTKYLQGTVDDIMLQSKLMASLLD
jgi:hypothetical protein